MFLSIELNEDTYILGVVEIVVMVNYSDCSLIVNFAKPYSSSMSRF